MKMRMNVLFAVFFIFFIYTGISFARDWDKPKDIIIFSGEWEPYSGKKLKEQGLMNGVVRKAFAEVGIQVTVKFKPWKRVSDFSVDRDNGLSCCWSWTNERTEKWFYSDVVVKDLNNFFVLKGTNFSFSSYESLKSNKIGVTRGKRSKKGKIKISGNQSKDGED